MGKKATMKGSGITFSSPNKNQVVPLTAEALLKSWLTKSVFPKEEPDVEMYYYYMYRSIHTKFIEANKKDLKEQLYKPIALLHDYMLFSKNINKNILSDKVEDKSTIIKNNIKSKGDIVFNFNVNTFLYYVLTYYNNIKTYNILLTTTVYHGTSRFAGSDLKVGNTITMKTFLSTSLYREVAELFAQKGNLTSSSTPSPTPTIFIITLENSTNYINVGNIEQQYEILLPIGSELFITEIETVLDKEKEKEIKEVHCIFKKVDDKQIQMLLNKVTPLYDKTYDGKICNHNHIAIEDVFDSESKNIVYSNWMRNYQDWLEENIRRHIRSDTPTTTPPGAIGESSTSSSSPKKRMILKQRKTDDDDDIGLDSDMINTGQNGAGSGKIFIGKKQFQCTPTNKVRIPLATAYKLHISLGFKNDTRLLGKERTIQGNKRQYILITPNEAKKLHQRALKRQ